MTAEQFHELLTQMDYAPMTYSGRGMYGAQCVSITDGPDGEDLRSDGLALLGFHIRDWAKDDQIDQLAEILEHTKTDSMGRGIVVYWPRLKYAEATE